ncbi:ornithine decarboxylase [Clostridium chauvoei]|uniref:ornithine decarboxylase n=2 Tax=Clostridium chauvoei TaxID=46867 RepID=S6ETA5_9CLOT|nr:ornithine decarboxylase [Clostridium chauvoei]ATD55726.1 ornithine decarboxylase [Clostridium chauvoei]ATD56598.1 ornithine decarboxylase [Clostridium chauvoei]MBX7280271.1 ornithine decarboxylase [Clostridium chauvoei]MBX7282756.1 ornithine decarboxylase [Clostridium chauvoei]MBX7285162.1 ornithine decarboxylase [Clostridium chauvoei]
MNNLKIAYMPESKKYFDTKRELVLANETDFTDVAAVVLTDSDVELINAAYDTKFGIPIFIVLKDTDKLSSDFAEKAYRVIDGNTFDAKLYTRVIENAAVQYEEKMLPPFFKTLTSYVERGNVQFDCPGHQGGQYFRKHPAGRYLYEFFGENVFRADICNADVALGDLLIHEGPAVDAEQNAARIYNADKTYFVMNGTSASNNVVVGSLVSPGDLVLFDRNNHKSVYNSALVQNGATPVYLETGRNPYGFIGGIDAHCFDEKYIREEISKVDPEKANEKRPFRLAVIQLGTYDGTIYNARQVVDKIGHLCDYILFDSAWVGYEQFIPMMRDCSPLLLELDENDPGIFVTQSVHKQQAGFSQASQIHKKDSHINGQRRYVDHKRFNNSFMLYASTSPFYPLYSTLDVNAKMQEGEAGRRLWADCIKLGVEARKSVLKNCSMIKPFIPPVVNGKKWEDCDTEEIANNIDFFRFVPGEKWHSFEGYGENQYFVDPNKFMLTTPGINAETGEYEDFGIPATILANYLREVGIIPEKNDLNSILFLLTPAETSTKMENLVAQFVKFEKLVKEDAPLSEVLPSLYKKNIERYKGYTIRQLCQEMHDFYKNSDAKNYQKRLFRSEYLPTRGMVYDKNETEARVMTAQDAKWALIRNNAKLVPLENIVGEIALEGALPYPPGVFCVVPGEVWSETARVYFTILQDGINQFPGFAPEIQGVYLEEQNDGKVKAFGYVLDNKHI